MHGREACEYTRTHTVLRSRHPTSDSDDHRGPDRMSGDRRDVPITSAFRFHSLVRANPFAGPSPVRIMTELMALAFSYFVGYKIPDSRLTDLFSHARPASTKYHALSHLREPPSLWWIRAGHVRQRNKMMIAYSFRIGSCLTSHFACVPHFVLFLGFGRQWPSSWAYLRLLNKPA